MDDEGGVSINEMLAGGGLFLFPESAERGRGRRREICI
jgi:hypothetical protein